MAATNWPRPRRRVAKTGPLSPGGASRSPSSRLRDRCAAATITGRHLGRPERRRRSGVDAADERIDETIGDLGAEAAGDQLPDGQRRRGTAAGQDQIQTGAAPCPSARGFHCAERRRAGGARREPIPPGMGRSRPANHSTARPAAGATSSLPRRPPGRAAAHRERGSMKASGPSSTRCPSNSVVRILPPNRSGSKTVDLGLLPQLPGGGQAGDAAPDRRRPSPGRQPLGGPGRPAGPGCRGRSRAARRGRG